MLHAHTEWAEEEFGGAKLGDKRRTSRLVAMAARMAEHPAGTLTAIFSSSGEREGAYRFVESAEIEPAEMERARGVACAKRLRPNSVVVVPIDQTSIQLPDSELVRDFGSVGSRGSGARGVHVMSGIAVQDGAVEGVLFQGPWVRDETPSPPRRHGRQGRRNDRRPPEARESYEFVRALQGCHEVLTSTAPTVQPWYQIDRGGDCWSVFHWAKTHSAWVTTRVHADRVVDHGGHLHTWIARRKVAFHKDVELRARSDSPARIARLSVRFGTTGVVLRTPDGLVRHSLSYVWITEPRPPPGVLEPLDWLLSTTYPVHTDEDADRVLDAYLERWHVEEFHYALKSGVCNIEASRLQSFDVFCRFLVLASSVAARVERIRLLSRTQPEAPATVAYTNDEIACMLRWRAQQDAGPKPESFPEGVPTLGLMTLWVAELGGYQKSRSRGPPGTLTLARGLLALDGSIRDPPNSPKCS